ncbi:MAG: hypothetical protein SGPRY_008429 [Prymnesium sp.]
MQRLVSGSQPRLTFCCASSEVKLHAHHRNWQCGHEEKRKRDFAQAHAETETEMLLAHIHVAEQDAERLRVEREVMMRERKSEEAGPLCIGGQHALATQEAGVCAEGEPASEQRWNKNVEMARAPTTEID